MKFDKLEVALRQLGTALQLFLEDRDPVSVHVLACGAIEIVEALVTASGKQPFKDIAINANSALTEELYIKIRTQHWNSFKHYSKKNGLPRDDRELFTMFRDQANDFHLFIGWYDYASIKGQMPAEVQCFMDWIFALQIKDGNAGSDRNYPDIRSKTRLEQKKMLQQRIRKYKRDRRLMDDPRREVRHLLLPNDLDELER